MRNGPTHRRAMRYTVLTSARFWCVFGLTALFCGALFFSGCWFWKIAQRPDLFPIRHIQVHGSLMHTSAVDIQKMIQANLAGNFFTLQVSKAREKIMSLPWAASVSFRRLWPDILRVHVIEQVPVARWNNHSLVNTAGQIFYPDASTIPTDLPIFSGPIDQAQAILDFYHIVSHLSKSLHLRVMRIDVSRRQSWQLTLTGFIQSDEPAFNVPHQSEFNHAITITLGRDDALKRFQRFLVIYPTLFQLAHQPITAIDLRYQNGLAVK